MKIFIVSQKDDVSTDEVIEYIKHRGGEIVRLNYENFLDYIHIQMLDKNYSASFNNEKLNYQLFEKSKCWYRRGLFSYKYSLVNHVPNPKKPNTRSSLLT